MRDKYYVQWQWDNGTYEFDDEDDMLEDVRKHYVQYGNLPVVYCGQRLQFEPAEIVKGWKVKETKNV